MEILETDRLLLHRWDPRFEQDFVRLAADPRVTRYVGDGQPWTVERASMVFATRLRQWDEHGYGWRAMIERDTGQWVGFEALNPLDSNAGVSDARASDIEIGWWLCPEAWGRGLATEGALAVRDEAFDRLGTARLVGRVQPGNSRSQRIMERLGMRRHGDAVGRSGEPILVYVLERTQWTETA